MKIGMLAVTVVLMAQVGIASAADAKRGQDLLEQKCFGCHGEDVYVRENRIIKNLDALNKRVAFCSQQAKASWFDEDIADVVEFLNTEYYHFK